MRPRELVDAIAHDDAEVLQAHPVDALVDGRDELDHRDRAPSSTSSGSASRILEIGRPFQTFSSCGRLALEQRADVDVLVPLGHAVGHVAQGIRGDVDAARGQTRRAAVAANAR